jgi:aspartoacylase
MFNKQPISNVVITAATHGNEMSGIQAIKQWQLNPERIAKFAPSSTVQLHLVNQMAMAANKRFIDQDLNRQFTHKALSENKTSRLNEHLIAQSFNDKFGPKGHSATDLLIDIHNTTSNMGPTLIILVNDEFHQQLARFVKTNMPEAIILIEDFQAYDDFGYLCTVGNKGVMIEVGPQAQGILKAKAYAETVKMTELILSFVEAYNSNTLCAMEPVEAFRLGQEIAFPTITVDGATQKAAMIHPQLDGQDFILLAKGSPCFIDFDGNEIIWEEEDTYPHFIGEAAYNHLHLAFATSSKCLF